MAVTRRMRPALAALGLPEDLLGGEARLTLLGSARLLIECRGGVAELGDELIRVRTRAGYISVRGEGLRLADARPDAVYVLGEIRSLSLPGASEGGDE